MKVGIIFFCLILISCLFIAFPDQNTAHSNMPTDFKPTDAEMQWAKKFIWLKFHTDYYKDFFLISDDRVSPHNWMRALAEFAKVIVLVFMVWQRSSAQEFKYVAGFLFIVSIDAIDGLVLSHNGAIVTLGVFPITWNIVSLFLYGYICLRLRYGNTA